MTGERRPRKVHRWAGAKTASSGAKSVGSVLGAQEDLVGPSFSSLLRTAGLLPFTQVARISSL